MSVNALHLKIKSIKPGDTLVLRYREVAAAALVDRQAKEPEKLFVNPVDVAVFVDKIEKEWQVELHLDRHSMTYTVVKIYKSGVPA